MGKNKKKGLTYAEAGVNIDAGEKPEALPALRRVAR